MTPSPGQQPHVLSPTSQGLLSGFTLSPEQRAFVHIKLGRDLPTETYEGDMVGNRVLVAPDVARERTDSGLLYKPRGAVEVEQMQMGSGWVLSVGPLVGLRASASDLKALVCDHPTDLLCRRILYPSYAGFAIRTNQEDSEFGGVHSLVTMTTQDIMMVMQEQGPGWREG